MLRMDKFLADCGLGTRSEVKKYIKAKQITLNGEVVTKPELKVEETSDIVCFKGKQLAYERYVYYLLHKPAGCVTAKQDNLHKTVMEYLPEDIPSDVAPVGRLDLDTEGLLLLTNDGELAHRLLSPAHHVPKIYYVLLDKAVPDSAISAFAEGIDIGDDTQTLPAELVILPITEEGIYSAELTIHEGRFHQVKRMFHAVGCEVTYLKRLSMGELTLGDLPLGEAKKLDAEYIHRIYP